MPGSKFTTGMGRSLWLNTLMSLTSSSLTLPTPLVEMVVVKCLYGRDGGQYVCMVEMVVNMFVW